MTEALSLPFSEHKIDRLSILSATTINKDTIVVLARGKPHTVRQMIIGVLLFFKVVEEER